MWIPHRDLSWRKKVPIRPRVQAELPRPALAEPFNELRILPRYQQSSALASGLGIPAGRFHRPDPGEGWQHGRPRCLVSPPPPPTSGGGLNHFQSRRADFRRAEPVPRVTVGGLQHRQQSDDKNRHRSGTEEFHHQVDSKAISKAAWGKAEYRQPGMNSHPKERTMFHASSAKASSQSTVRLI